MLRRCRSGLEARHCHLPTEDGKALEEAPLLGPEITVESPPSAKSGLTGPPTRFGSLPLDSSAKERHSEVSSTERDSSTSPHSEHIVSPAEWSNTTSVSMLQSRQNMSDIPQMFFSFSSDFSLGFCLVCF